MFLAAPNAQVRLQHLAEDEWILFTRSVNPVIHDTILETAGKEAVSARHTREISTAQEAFHLVSKHAGVAIVLAKCLGTPCRRRCGSPFIRSVFVIPDLLGDATQ